MFFISILFSFAGVLVRYSGLMFNSYWISFLRFFIGLLFLALFILIGRKKLNLRFFCVPVIFGAICKSINYLTENYGLSHGYSYGNIIVWPVQCIIALAFSVLIFKDKIGIKGIIGSFLCIAGITVISWNGKSLNQFIGDNGLFFLILFVVSGIGAAGFIIAQKLLLHKMSSENMNFSMFFISAIITAAPLPFVGEITGKFYWPSIICIIIFGFSTGAGFFLMAKAMKTIPIYMITIIQSTSVIFTLVWAVLFFNETITGYIMAGTLIFVAGMIITNIKFQNKSAA